MRDRDDQPTDASDPDGATRPLDDTAGERAPGAAPTGAPLTQQVGRVVVAVIAVLFGVFAVFNSQSVSFDWIFGETIAEYSTTGEHLAGGVPLIVLLVASFALGAVVGWFATWRRGRRRTRRG
ncbi:MAG: lipopolysaccharide assembly LapA domain-containing protein [Actinomycetes bacterium]